MKTDLSTDVKAVNTLIGKYPLVPFISKSLPGKKENLKAEGEIPTSQV